MSSTSEPTLRTLIETRRAQGQPASLEEALPIAGALAAELAEQHRAGYTFFVYPSALYFGQDQLFHAGPASAQPPTDPRDLACLPPESQGRLPGSARASVYSVGAILYELLSLQSVGPGMRPLSQVAPGTPPELDQALSFALASDPAARPDDLHALAQALYQIHQQVSRAPAAAAPRAAAPEAPAPVITSAGGGAGPAHFSAPQIHFSLGPEAPAAPAIRPMQHSIEIDVSMSLMPKPGPGMGAEPPRPPSPGPAPIPGAIPMAQTADELHAIKTRLEADPAPRYVVVKSGMDHGPFRAVELLQQIASHTFEEEDLLRIGAHEPIAIKDHPDFAPFARHARLHRHEKAEKAAIAQAVVQESRSLRGKALIGVIALGLLGAAAVVFILTKRGQKSDAVAVVEETAANVESDAGLVKKKSVGGGGVGRVTGSVGGIPQLSGGMSCEAAQNAYVEEMKIGAKGGQADLTAGQFQAILGHGAYLNSCGVPDSMGVNVCAAIQNGRAVGVTVTTTPRNPQIQSCIASRVRAMSFPSHPKLDITRTKF